MHQIVTREKSKQIWKNELPDFAREFCLYYPQYEDYLKSLESWEETLAATWCMDNYFLTEPNKKPYIIMPYEKLFQEGESVLQKLFDYLNLSWNLSVMEKFSEKSRMVVKGSNITKGGNPVLNWTEKLDDNQVQKILGVFSSFGINCYSKNPEPDYEFLNRITEYPL